MLAASTRAERALRTTPTPAHLTTAGRTYQLRCRRPALPTRPRRTPATCTALLSADAAVAAAQQLLDWAQPVAAKVTPKMAFHSSTGLMVLTYPLMMFLPRFRLTRFWVQSPAIPLFFAFLHLVLLLKLFAHGLLPEMCSTVLHTSPPLPSIPHIGALFHSHLFTATAWLHLLMFDFLQARYVWEDGLNHLLPTAHSLLLCFMAGPLGLLSHLGTKVLVFKSRGLPLHS